MADVDVAAVAVLIGHRARAAMLDALMAGELTASELTLHADVSAPTASVHLAKLVRGGLLVAERRGRQRYFRIADHTVAEAIEALAVIAPSRPTRSLRDAHSSDALRTARTCYDHLAGQLGLAIVDTLERRGALRPVASEYIVTAVGARLFSRLGIDVDELARGRRGLARQCLDWSERRPHLAGALGAALTDRLFELGWLARRRKTRAVELRPAGIDGLVRSLGLRRRDLAGL